MKALYEVKATKNGKTMIMNFLSAIEAQDCARKLSEGGATVKFQPDGIAVYTQADKAIESFNFAVGNDAA